MKTLLAAAALLASACAPVPVRTSLGDITVRSALNPGAAPATVGIQTGRIVSGNIDFTLDADGCARGIITGKMLVFCPKEATDKALVASRPGGTVERWAGSGGEITLEVDKDRKSVRADGFFSIGKPVQVTLQFGQGPQWDELRAHPILVVVAASMVGIRGEALVEN